MTLFPGWLLAAMILTETGILVWAHKRLSIYEKAALIMPAVVVASIYIILDVIQADTTEEVRSVVRLSLFFWLFWKSVFLYLTRKRHA